MHTVSRRTALRLGLAGTGVGLSVGAAWLTTEQPMAQTTTDPVHAALQDQIKEAIDKMRGAHPSEGLQQAATVLHIAAATFDDAALTAAVRRADTQALLRAEPNYHELERVGRAVGADLARLTRTGNRQIRQEMLTQLRKTGFATYFRQSATLLDKASKELQRRERQAQRVAWEGHEWGVGLIRVLHRQDQEYCGDCQRICALVWPALEVATVACAVMIAWPPAAAACSGATLAFLTFTAACAACEAYIMWCMENGGI